MIDMWNERVTSRSTYSNPPTSVYCAISTG
nr:MAG TPA: hypothetical protein [Caudoviricetes sp.]